MAVSLELEQSSLAFGSLFARNADGSVMRDGANHILAAVMPVWTTPNTSAGVSPTIPDGVDILTISATDSNGAEIRYATVGVTGATLPNNSTRTYDPPLLLFQVDDVTGAVTKAPGADLSIFAGYTFELPVTATNHVFTLNDTLTLAIYNLAIDVANYFVPEGSAPGTVVGIVTATGGQTPYTFSDPLNNSTFAVQQNGSDWEIIVEDNAALVYPATVNFTVEVADSNGQTASREFLISTTEVVPPPVLNDLTIDVLEGTPLNTVLTTMMRSGGGPVDFWFFQVSGFSTSTRAPFTIAQATGEVTNSSAMDVVDSPYTRTVLAGNAGGSDTATLTINAILPVSFADASYDIAEGSVDGTAIAVLAASDGLAPLSYSLITDSTPAGIFAVDAAGNLTVADGTQLDYEDGLGNSFALVVRATDSYSPANTDDATITVNVTNVAATIGSGATGSLDNATAAANDVVASVTATDGNTTTGTWAIVGISSGGGNPASYYEIVSTGNATADLRVAAAGVGNFSGGTDIVTLRFTETASGATDDETVEVTVTGTTNPNAPTVTINTKPINIYQGTVFNFNTSVSSLTITNPTNGTIQLSTNDSRFIADAGFYGNSLQVVGGSTFNAATEPTINVIVSINDPAIPPDPNHTDMVTVNISPIAVTINQILAFGPNGGPPAILHPGQLAATDQNGDPVSVAFQNLTDASVIKVSDGSTVPPGTAIPLSAVNAGEYYLDLTSTNPSYTVDASSVGGSSNDNSVFVTIQPADVDVTGVAGSGVSDYDSAETVFAGALPAWAVDGTQYYYDGADGYARATASVGFYGNFWNSVYLFRYASSAPSGVSTAVNSRAGSGFFIAYYLFQGATRYRQYEISGSTGSRTWNEQTT